MLKKGEIVPLNQLDERLGDVAGCVKFLKFAIGPKWCRWLLGHF